jgi:hypothetical protein
MLDEGVYRTLEDLARVKGVHATYVSRILRLTLLAPEIVEAILDGRQEPDVTLARMSMSATTRASMTEQNPANEAPFGIGGVSGRASARVLSESWRVSRRDGPRGPSFCGWCQDLEADFRARLWARR